MKMLTQNRDEEKKRIEEQIKKEMKAESDQLRNMNEANMKEAQKQREEFSKKNRELQDRLDEMQKREMENMKITKKLTEQLEKVRQDLEKVEEPGAFKKFCGLVQVAAPLIGAAASFYYHPLAPVAAPVGMGTGAAAGSLTRCSVM